MTSKKERISNLENELRKHNIAKKELCNLESLCLNINNRMIALCDLKAEIEDISRGLHYYDMVDYLGNMSGSALPLRQIAHLMRELDLAQKRFAEDTDGDYLSACAKIQRRCATAGLERLDAAFRGGECAAEDVALFLESCDGEVRRKAERSYFCNRRKSTRDKISECIADLKKNYKLVILGEIQGYSRLFCGSDILNKYKKMGFPKKADDFNSLEAFIYDLFAEAFKKTTHEGARRIYLDVSRDRENVLNGIFLGLLRIYFGPEIRNSDAQGMEI